MAMTQEELRRRWEAKHGRRTGGPENKEAIPYDAVHGSTTPTGAHWPPVPVGLPAGQVSHLTPELEAKVAGYRHDHVPGRPMHPSDGEPGRNVERPMQGAPGDAGRTGRAAEMGAQVSRPHAGPAPRPGRGLRSGGRRRRSRPGGQPFRDAAAGRANRHRSLKDPGPSPERPRDLRCLGCWLAVQFSAHHSADARSSDSQAMPARARRRCRRERDRYPAR